MEEIYEYFLYNTNQYLLSHNKEYRKSFSQFFTPVDIAKFMVEDLKLEEKKEHLFILEPAAGAGILLLALLEKIYKEFVFVKKITIVAFEIDHNLYGVLTKNINFMRNFLKNQVEIEPIIKNMNFIDEYGEIWKDNNNFFSSKRNIYNKFDLIISNPPYKKINKNSHENIYFDKLILGQPNLYHLFIALSLKLLDKNGIFMLISPKNYLGGKYTEKLRRYIFEKFSLYRLHIFNERNKIFNGEILQEICISHYKNKKENSVKLTYNGKTRESFKVKISDILMKNSYALLFLRTKEDLNFKLSLKKDGKTLKEQGLIFRVGEIVQFRIPQSEKKTELFDSDGIPLLIVQHIKKSKINYCEVFSRTTAKKNISLKFTEMTKKKSLKNENYVVLRKNVDFATEDFIQATVIKKGFFESDYIAIDNNLAYITSINGELSYTRARKISAYLNSEEFERYYKMLNNSHTINSYEIENMFFPIF